MRGLFLLLLLTNAAFIAWQYFHDQGEQGQADVYRGIEVVNDGLSLISELPPGQQPALRKGAEDGEELPKSQLDAEMQQASQATDNIISATAQTGMDGTTNSGALAGGGCQQITDIDGRPTLERIIKLLSDHGATVLQQGETQFKRTNYWVILPPYPSRAKADEAAAILSRWQIRDFFIVRSGDYVNAVSLGVFSTRERASLRYRQIVELKARLRRPQIEAIELPAKRYFVSYKVADKASHTKLQSSLKKQKYPLAKEIGCK